MSAKNAMEEVDEDSKLALEPEALEGTHRDAGDDSDTPPTAEHWKTMKGYGSFITHDETEVEHMFHVNDFIYVLPAGRDPDEEVDKTELWLAQIRSIRAHDSDNVWIRAKWFYHPKELPQNAKGVRRKFTKFGNFERISSNQADFIRTSTCCGLAKITQYDEQNLEQEDIEPGSFYYRCEYDWRKQLLKKPPIPCSICKKTYNPDTDIVHFCPRPGCRRSWHAPCLAKTNWLIKSEENFSQRMVSLDRDYVSPDAPKSNPKKKARPAKSKEASVLNDPYARMPTELLAVAQQPIARGGVLGLVGNVRSVFKARSMVQNALKGIEDIPEDWEARLGKVFDVSGIGPAATKHGTRSAVSYQCPKCGEPI
ncbi:hypothetical protein JB92DRAFT_2902684 [Gautieria morchelliformis]|nr:hypothetical protein JB92DRAFT_2902684 [Gautieria morchelliformis]